MEDLRDITEQAAGIRNNTDHNKTIESILRDINDKLKNIDDAMSDWDGRIPSQSNYRTFFRDKSKTDDFDFAPNRRSFRNSNKGLIDSFEDELIKGIVGSNFRNDVYGVFKKFADQLNVEIRNIPSELGRQFGRVTSEAIRNSNIGRQLIDPFLQLRSNLIQNFGKLGGNFIDNLLNSHGESLTSRIDEYLEPLSGKGGIGAFFQGAGLGVNLLLDVGKLGLNVFKNLPRLFKDVLKGKFPTASDSPAQPSDNQNDSDLADTIKSNTREQILNDNGIGPDGGLGNVLSSTLSTFTTELSGGSSVLDSFRAAGGVLTESLVTLGPAALAAAGAFVALEVVTHILSDTIGEVFSGIKKIFGALGNAANRDQVQREKNLEAYKARMKSDYETMVRAPFEILKDAASEIYSAWNQNLEKVSATQGYTKADVQDLMAAYAERIRDEGLSKYVSGSDLFKQLAQVLDSGLSGKVAEEFAYQATILGKAIPTQDFFNYASTYSSVAANAIRQGMTQEQAIAKANESLQEFASNLLYANRELSGGFTTGLKNAESIYSEASKIALAAHSDNLNAISGSILAIQGYVGAVAPDVADALTNTIYTLATGGNSPSSVALRSLSGVNASNTEFLKAFAKNPQEILGTMFENLASIYTESPDAYMEKAEGYAQLFGVDASAFQRVDFNELATAIRNMNLESTSLNENMQLLLDGQTTTTAEQLKAQQINQYMIDEGLAYVIDNETAQLIQQHMWEEQMQRELVQSTFAVDFAGDTREGFMKIIDGVQNILNFLNPFGWLKKLFNVAVTAEEVEQQKADIGAMLELGKVGKGSYSDFYNLTTSNQDLGLATPLVNLLGGTSKYNYASGFKDWFGMSNPLYSDFSNTTSEIGYNRMHGINSEIAGFDEGEVQSPELKGIESMLKSTTSAIEHPLSRYSWGMVSKSQAESAKTVLDEMSEGFSDAFNSLLTNFGIDSETSANVSASTAKAAIDKMLEESYLKDKFVKENKSFEDWAASASTFGISDLDEAITSAGYNKEDIEKYFADTEAQAGMEESHERSVREEDFWESGKKFWNDYYPNVFEPNLIEELEFIETDYLQKIIDRQDAWSVQFNTTWTDWLSKYDTTNTNWSTQYSLSYADWAVRFNLFSSLWSEQFKNTASAWSEQYNKVSSVMFDEISNFAQSWFLRFNMAWQAWLGAGNDSGAWGRYTSSVNSWIGAKDSMSWGDYTNKVTDFWGISDGGNSVTLKTLYELIADFMAYRSYYGVQSGADVTTSTLLKKLEQVNADTKKEERESSAYQMGKILADTLVTDETTDPTLQTNILLGQILVYVGQIVQQTNNPVGGTALIDTLSAMSLGLTQKTP